jgi:hypothetical protein
MTAPRQDKDNPGAALNPALCRLVVPQNKRRGRLAVGKLGLAHRLGPEQEGRWFWGDASTCVRGEPVPMVDYDLRVVE